MIVGAIDRWFHLEVLRWRTGAAIAWSMLTIPMIMLIYIFLTTTSIYSPLVWMSEFLTTVASGSFYSMMLLVMITNCAFFIYSSKTFTVAPRIPVLRLSQLVQVFKSQVLVYAAVCCVCGSVVAWTCTCLLGDRYTHLSYRCTNDSELYCINEYHLFLVLYGGFTGLTYLVYHYVKQHNHLTFPTIQQARYFRVRGSICREAWLSLGHVIWQIKYFYLSYYILGHIPRDWIADTLSLKFGHSFKLDSLYGLLLDVALFWHTLLTGLFIQFVWSYGGMLYKIYHTEHYEFQISSMFDDYKNKCLVDAMACVNSPLIQALGYFDLNTLAKHSRRRRKELFSLSQPGGHPHNWNKVSETCLSAIGELNQQVAEWNWKLLASVSLRQPAPAATTIGTATPVKKGTLNGTKETGTNQETAKPQKLKDKIVTMVKKRFESPFVTSDTPETSTSNLFVSSFIQIWAVEALSTLVVSSYHEDSYGVVQMSLPDIITGILGLQENVDKHFKLSGGLSRRSLKDHTSNELPLKYLLQTTLKSSIYRIVDTFGKHLLELDLPPEAEKKLHHFIAYKE